MHWEIPNLNLNISLYWCPMSLLQRMLLLYPVLYCTLNSIYNEKKYAEILLHYRWLFIKGDVFIGERGIFGAEVFLCYRQFFIKSNFVIGRVECMVSP